MQNRKGLGQKLMAILDGKGFYIVLFLCVGVVGASALAILRGGGADVEGVAAGEPAAIIEPDGGPSAPAAVPDTQAGLLTPDEEEELLRPPEPVGAINEPEDVGVWSQQEDEVWIAEPDYYVWPVNGEVETAYSMDALVYSVTLGDWRAHDGLDIAAELGAHVCAVSGGTVERVYADDLYGTTVIIDHGGGLKSVYANLAATPTVVQGDNVKAGEVIGAVGGTALCESSQSAHLHFAMSLDGASVDPGLYMP